MSEEVATEAWNRAGRLEHLASVAIGEVELSGDIFERDSRLRAAYAKVTRLWVADAGSQALSACKDLYRLDSIAELDSDCPLVASADTERILHIQALNRSVWNAWLEADQGRPPSIFELSAEARFPDGSTMSWNGGSWEWRRDGLLHRQGGPAVIHFYGGVEFWQDGLRLS